VYLDSSALVKLVIREPESRALRRYLASEPTRVSSALARVEVPLASRRHGDAAVTRARQTLARIGLVRLDDLLLDAAGSIDLAGIRSLDAIHLATAQALGEELVALVTYDGRMGEAARSLGLPVDEPR
jgi:hypothetical protein